MELDTATVIAGFAALTTAIVYLYKRQSAISAASFERQEETSADCQRQREELHRSLLESQRNFADKLAAISERFATLVSGNLQAMEGMSENLAALREVIETPKKAERAPQRKRRGKP